MKLRDLNTFMAVVQTGGMTEASHRLYAAQSTVSKSIASLEAVIGKKLLDRTPRGVTLTGHGQVMFDLANSITQRLRKGFDELEALDDPSSTELRLATSEPASASLVLTTLADFSKKFPKSRYVIELGHPTDVCEKVRTRQVDFAVTQVFPGLGLDGLIVEELGNDPIVIVCNATHRLAKAGKLNINLLAPQKWVLPPPSSFISSQLRRMFEEAGIPAPQPSATTHSAYLRLLMVADADFFTVVPQRMLAGSMRRLPVKALSLALPSRPLCLIRRKKDALSPTARLFISSLADGSRATSLP